MRSAACIILAALSLPHAARGATAEKPRHVVERYYAAINHGHLRDAYAMWWNGGAASHQSYASFARGYALTRAATVVTGPAGAEEGAAGSFYIDVPVQVSAMQKDGVRRHYAGTYTLRRVDGQIDGVDPNSLTWHLYAADLHLGK